MTTARANDDQAVTRPTASMKVSIPSASCSAAATSALENLAVVDRLAVAGPFLVLGHICHIRVIDLLGHGILGDRLGENLRVGFAQRLHDRIRKRLSDEAMCLDK